MNVPRIAVVGAGFSGLAAAHRLTELARDNQQPVDVVVFEGSERVGGVLGTREIAGYQVETGADSFITNKPWAVNLCRRLGIEDQLIPTDDTHRRSLVLYRGKPTPVPEGFMLLTPAKIWPVLRSPLFSLRGKLRMGLEYFLPAGKQTDPDESLGSFVRRRFGKESLARLVQPLVGGIYTADPEKLSLAATMPRFLDMEREHGSLIRASRKSASSDREKKAEQQAAGARYGLFATPREGISQLVQALLDRVTSQCELRLNTPVTRVHAPDDTTPQWRVDSAQNPGEFFDAVVLALPAYRSAELLGDVDAELAEQLGQIEYASSAIVVSGHKLTDITHPLDAFGLVIPAAEKRKILAVSFTSRKFPSRAPAGCVQLRTFVGGAMQPEEFAKSDDEIIALVQQELREILGVEGKPDFVHVARWHRAMPQYHVGHLERIAAIEVRTELHAGLALAGNAFHGVGVPDVIHRGERSAERIWTALQQPG